MSKLGDQLREMSERITKLEVENASLKAQLAQAISVYKEVLLVVFEEEAIMNEIRMGYKEDKEYMLKHE